MCAQAAREPRGSVERLLWVGAFAVSGYSSTAGRTSKPFNPLLGETYELVHAQKGLRAVVEKARPSVEGSACMHAWALTAAGDPMMACPSVLQAPVPPCMRLQH
jgi:hypothetical protein